MSKIFDNLLSTKSLHSKDPIDQYIFNHSLRYTSEQLELLEDIKNLPEKIQPWLGSTDEAQFFQILIRLMNSKRAIEIGTFTGYTSLTIALALPSDGELITCDITDEYVRQDIWIKAGVRNKINLQIRPALETLHNLLEKYGENSFDFIFIDGDKKNYLQYYELSLQLIHSNGLIVIDNTLWNGRVLNKNDTSIETITIRQINELIKNDNRVDISFLRLAAFNRAKELVSNLNILPSLKECNACERNGLSKNISDSIRFNINSDNYLATDSGSSSDSESDYDDEAMESNEFDSDLINVDEEDKDAAMTQNFDEIKTEKINFTGIRIFDSINPGMKNSYFQVQINNKTKFIHKQTACWLLTDKVSRLSADRLSRVIETNKKD
ncbi:unnamed protein product [Rotaria sp. Silwood1]|nr:unnamed protein product [Rotaria sp. Silwood1]CAF1603297.1 unnamed protein product [Rotaria sp. Silwood1]